MASPSLTLTAYRIRDDDISSPNGTPTWLGDEDSNPTSSIGTSTTNSFVFRVQVDETNNKIWIGTLTLNYDYMSGTATGAVTSSSSYVRMYGATSRGGISDDTAITSQKLANTPGSGSWEDGNCDTATGSYAETTVKDGWTEHEFIVYIVDGDVSDADTIELNITGQDVTTPTFPTITVTKAAAPLEESGADTTDLSDSSTAALTAVAAGSETTDLSDSSTGVLTAVESGSEQTDLSDSAVGGLLVGESGADTAELSDSVTGDVKITGAGAEQTDLSDSAATALTAVGLGAETTDLSDTGTGVLQAVNSGAETTDLSDAATAALTLPLSGTDTAELSDSATAIAILVESATDTLEVSDTGAAIGTFGVSVTDTAELSDSGVDTAPSAAYSYCKIIFGA